ncbi:helix-turn-helix domain-containing protein [Rhizobium leguminosarum bv. viciae]|nr:AraC family transcriptional regulator [Rhizobium binae]NKL49827.1 helix-turn-helix domain-containing protein [Rhizobium leguminosarum bv. viciae]QSY85302.1 AraC family transcriptional regulator [Rhizobium binae]
MQTKAVMVKEKMEFARGRMRERVEMRLPNEGSLATAIPGLSLHRRACPTAPDSSLYEPSFAFIISGAKRVILGDETYLYDQDHFLLTAVGLPTIVQVLDASIAAPYVSFKLDIDLDLARELIAEVDQLGGFTEGRGSGIAIGPVTPELTSAAMRLLDLLDHPVEIPILARSIQREILYRVMTGPVGSRLRHSVQVGTQTNRVSTAIRWLRENYDQPIRIESLADIAGMGESTLHHHFRALTAMSPVQYQKHLRLHEARRIMIADRVDASSAALRVGYESVTQFNREYRRLFGVPPKKDVRTILSLG